MTIDVVPLIIVGCGIIGYALGYIVGRIQRVDSNRKFYIQGHEDTIRALQQIQAQVVDTQSPDIDKENPVGFHLPTKTKQQ